MNLNIVTQAKPGESVCGDAGQCWPQHAQDGPTVLALSDGLGHGPDAAEASQAALAFVGANLTLTLDEIFADCDRAIRRTRGVALGIAVIDAASRSLTFAAVGNIRAGLFGEKSRLFNSSSGIVGAGITRLTAERANWADGDLLMMWTDGLPPQISLRGLAPPDRQDPGIVAPWLAAQFTTGKDDVGIACIQLRGMSGG